MLKKIPPVIFPQNKHLIVEVFVLESVLEPSSGP